MVFLLENFWRVKYCQSIDFQVYLCVKWKTFSFKDDLLFPKRKVVKTRSPAEVIRRGFILCYDIKM